MADISKLVPHILKWEGGFVNDPYDSGGATNKGVTLKTFEIYCRRKGYPRPTIERLKNISDEEWMEIFKGMYWDRCMADEIVSQPIANIIVDWYYNAGKHAIRHTQKVLGVKVDGIIGPKTIAAINSQSPLPLFGSIKTARKKYYENICRLDPNKCRYLKGWLNRTNDIMYE